MDNITQTTTTPAPASTPAPAPAPMPAAAPAPAMPMMNDGGTVSSGGSLKDTIKSLNPTEVLIGVLVVAALFHSIDYFRNNSLANKDFMKKMQSKLDELDMKVADVSSIFHAQQSAPAMQMDGFF